MYFVFPFLLLTQCCLVLCTPSKNIYSAAMLRTTTHELNDGNESFNFVLWFIWNACIGKFLTVVLFVFYTSFFSMETANITTTIAIHYYYPHQ